MKENWTAAELAQGIRFGLSSSLTTRQRAHTVLEAASRLAANTATQLSKVYEEGDPKILRDAWANSWVFINKIFVGKLFTHKLPILIEIDNTIRAHHEGIDPLSLPLDHPDPSIATFYEQFKGTVLPKSHPGDKPSDPEFWVDRDDGDEGDDTPEAVG